MNTTKVLEKVFGTDYSNKQEIETAYQKAFDEMMNERDEEKVKIQAKFHPSQKYEQVFKKELTEIFGLGVHQIGEKEITLQPGLIDNMYELKSLLQAYFENPELDSWVDDLKATQQEKGYKPGWVWYRIKEKHGEFVASLLS